MMYPELKGYKITDRLTESKSTLVYRGQRSGNDERVVLKILKPDALTKDKRALFRCEFEITSGLELPSVVKALAIEDNVEGCAIVFKDIDGRSLDQILEHTPLTLIDSLELAIVLVETVGLLHQQQITHKNINPSHIIFNPMTKQVNLIGFGLADRVPEQSVTLLPPSNLKKLTLAYMSPEQTGKMNTSADYRTDFYSIGVTLYQMLTGKLPFETDDALEMVYCHIVRTPVAPHELNADIPEIVSQIVMKLMSKMADDRYQSALGLKVDLEKCLQELREKGNVESFKLGPEDFSDQLRFPGKLYGRDKEFFQLLHTFERVGNGNCEMLLIAGYAGVGKTRLVRKVHKTVIERHGFFVEGKFEQVLRNIPYFGWTQAFEELVDNILIGSQTELAQWRHRIRKAVGHNGKVLTDIIPNLELIIGPQPDVPVLAGTEAQNRFNLVFLEFVKSISNKQRPLVVFLDDLQWIEEASLQLLHTLMTARDVTHLLVIGAYRDNEVDALHPLSKGIDELRRSNSRLELFTIRELSEENVDMLIADTLHDIPVQTSTLTHHIYSKTGGNPFFIIQTLKNLVETRAISFNTTSHTWQWEVAAIERMEITDNIISLMVEKIRRLTPETRCLLPLAASIGFRFSPYHLSIISGLSEKAVMQRLLSSLREGLLVAGTGYYRFVHDRVQQAAYTLIPPEERPARHLMIGRLLLDHTPEDNLKESIFEITGHLNRGALLVTLQSERNRLAELNLIAGRCAKSATAFALAAHHFAAGKGLLDSCAWETNYNLASALLLEQAESEYLVGNYEHSDELLSEALGLVVSISDRAWVYRLRQRLYQLSGRFKEAEAITIEALRLFGMYFPKSEEDIKTAINGEIRQVSVNLRGRRITELADVPLSDDADSRALIGLLEEAMPLIYTVRPLLWPLITARGVNLSLDRGHADESPFVYSCYSMVLAGFIHDIPSAIQFSEMAIALNERLPGKEVWRGKLLFHHGAVVNIWKRHFSTNLSLLDQAFHASLETGDFVNAGYLTYNAIWLHLENGDPLEQVVQLARRYADFARQIHNDIILNVDRIEEHFLLSLQGKTHSLIDYGNAFFSEISTAAAIERSGFALGTAYYFIMKVVSTFFAGQYHMTLEWANRAQPKLLQVASMANEVTYYFYYALALAALYEQNTSEKQKVFLGILKDILEKLKFWANHCPENFSNRHALVAAEIARIEHRDQQAMRLYEEAIASAKRNKFVQNEGVAYEVAAAFYLQRGFEKFARAYFSEAVNCYSRWGAFGKVGQLERRYPWLVLSKTPETTAQSQPLDNDTFKGSFGTVIDVTTSKRGDKEPTKLEAYLQRTQKMEAIGRLAGGVAHEFNNMLEVIIGYVDMGLESLYEQNPMYRNLREVRKAAQHAADITSQLLTFARKQLIYPRQLDLNETVESMVKVVGRLIGENIELIWVPGQGLWKVMMDPSQINQLLENLAVNAKDAIPETGKVTIETGNITLDKAYCISHVGFTPGRFVVLSFSDNGCGMDKEVIKHIFEPFFTTRSVGKGTGLGLATIYGIVKQNNGFINVYSKLGKGTSFKIFLPECTSESSETAVHTKK